MTGDAAADLHTEARTLLDGLRDGGQEPARLAETSVKLADVLWRLAEGDETREERRRRERLARMMEDPTGQAFTTLLTDRVHRSSDVHRVADEARFLLEALGIPGSMSRWQTLQLRAFRAFGSAVPSVAVPAMLGRLREETASVILPAERDALRRHLAARRREGVRMNINHLGEAVLGEEEAERRLRIYEELLVRPEIDCISVKISSIASQLDPVSWEQTVGRLAARLRRLYRVAASHEFEHADGSRAPKLVNLDMEAYRDLYLTWAAFRRALDDDALLGLQAGIVLQAYLPESLRLQQELTRWAMERRKRGGAPVRLRIVKGANLAMEKVEASLHGWELAVHPDKTRVDAAYKAMVRFGCRPEHADAVHLGVASHNVFDLAYGMCVRATQGVEAQVGFELLEGMADPLRRAVQQVSGQVLLYAPIVDENDFHTAIAYLQRRLDENTEPENFLRHSFELQPGDAAWQEQQARFETALQRMDDVSAQSRRHQDRRRPPRHLPLDAPFANEPDTDFTQPRHREWLQAILDRWQERDCFEVPLQIGGRMRREGRMLDGFDPSRPGCVPYRVAVADEAELEQALQTAAHAARSWASRPRQERSETIANVATGLREQRGELIAAMALDGAKNVHDADSEVSEAIDFCEYYRRSLAELHEHEELRIQSKGVITVTPPWNFPLAIPCGGTVAALVAGNAALLKPALETPLVGYLLARICWDAGVPQDVLQLVTCEDEVASALIRDPRVTQVVLTGGTDTARMFLKMRPTLELMAETGGKNALIISALADRDLAIKDLVHSAFRHAGQKCSAASLAICEAEVYDDPEFQRQLRDAAASLPVGPAWQPDSVVTPLIHPPRGPLEHGITQLEEGERWLLQPRPDPDNPRLWSPGIKLGVRAGSFTHQTELFGPVLGVMRAEDLDHAIQLANGTPYGLTGGLHSLDEREQRHWAAHIDVGNAYINRTITGAIVRRQPFGGHKLSGFGPGAKAGGPNYVAQMCRITQASMPRRLRAYGEAVDRLARAAAEHLDGSGERLLLDSAKSYAYAWETHFGRIHDPSGLRGQDNLFRYQPASPLLILAERAHHVVDLVRACAAALTCGVEFNVCIGTQLAQGRPWLAQLPGVQLSVCCSEDLIRLLEHASLRRIRAVGPVSERVRNATLEHDLHVATQPVMATGRIELRHYLIEQALCIEHHRYGNLARALDVP